MEARLCGHVAKHARYWRELIASGRNSIGFVKENFKRIAALRAGCVQRCAGSLGIGAYVGAIGLLLLVDILPDGNEVYSHIYDFYLWMAVPIVIALSVVMLLLRPIYVLAMCDLYSDYLESKESLPTAAGRCLQRQECLGCFWADDHRVGSGLLISRRTGYYASACNPLWRLVRNTRPLSSHPLHCFRQKNHRLIGLFPVSTH